MADSRHLEKVLAHAEDQLVVEGKQRPSDVLSSYKKFLKLEEHRLRLKHQAGGGGREICARRAELVDVILKHVFNAAANSVGGEKGALALVALGGYGRGELNPFSDVDVMLLHAESGGRILPYVQEMAEQILYLLWDVGFKVGHSTRSVKEALAQANRDMLTKTAMLESRFLAGERELAREFRDQFRAKCVLGFEREYVEARMHDQETRHRKFGDSVYMQEPNIKNGCGGLRDYQNLLWMSYFKEGVLTTTHLVGRDWLSESDQRRIENAYDFLLRLRTDLHYFSKRAADVLHLNLQEEIARRLRYREKGGQRASEALMRDYYKHTRNIFRVTERITEQFASGYATRGTRTLFSFLPVRGSAQTQIGSFVIRYGQLHTNQRDLFKIDSLEMMRAFELAQQHNVDLSPELEDLISRSLRQITRTYRYAKSPREIFMSILSRKGEVGRTLRLMHRVDFLGRYLPEFGQLTCLVQHEFFHRYTADEHTLLCIDKLDALMRTDNPKLIAYRRLFENLDEPFVLYLALLLHDTGRAVGARPHSEASALFARGVAKRLQLSSEQRKALILLVDHHVTLSNIAQQRNLDDPATIVEFASIVRNQKKLHALMLLTLADGQGTSGQSWSDWKETLVWQLFHATSNYLVDQKAYLEQTRIEREILQQAVAAQLPPDFSDEIEAHFDFMPDNYFRASKVHDIVHDLQLFRTFFENASGKEERALSPAVTWEAFLELAQSIVCFCTWDREDLLAKIAGSFSVVPLNILSADIYSREDHTVLAIFRVSDMKERAVNEAKDREIVESTLQRALEVETFEFTPQLEEARRKIHYRRLHELEFPTAITIDNKAHPVYTLIQIETPDRVGLLYDLLTALGREGTDIVLSRISTQKGAAVDTFYLTDNATGTKITDSNRIAGLQRRLRAAILSGAAR
ncbi:MAG TPA: [protein-PII] uridylyltransferase [Chthoniobacterales bacterium]|jgi:[protein-PII] uridylyltransferase|nr:[protein-PII] uridylyltransferase [Chthoniobacterales bacterium]